MLPGLDDMGYEERLNKLVFIGASEDEGGPDRGLQNYDKLGESG